LTPASSINLQSLVVGLKSALEVANALEGVSLANVAGAGLGRYLDYALEIDESLLELLKVNVNLPPCLIRFDVSREPLYSSRELEF